MVKKADSASIHGSGSGAIHLRPIEDSDQEFLYRVYASTRAEEMTATGWDAQQIESFLRMQFRLQHVHYTMHFPKASFCVILRAGISVGRLYTWRSGRELRVMDIALLPEFRLQGVGRRIMLDLAAEADEAGLVLSLHVEMNNPVLAFYKALGFQQKESRGVYYYMEREAPTGDGICAKI